MIQKRKAVVIDLDWTLLQTNTFKDYIVFVAKKALCDVRPHITMILLGWVLCRKCRLISHQTMKYWILRVTQSFMTESYLRNFVSQIKNKKNGKVVELCQNFRQAGYFMLLSTAAPENYVRLLCLDFLFDDYCASPLPQQGTLWKENVCEQKRNNTLSLLQKKNVMLDVMITDHYDDLPLLKEKKRRNILVSPTVKTIDKLSQLNIKYEILK